VLWSPTGPTKKGQPASVKGIDELEGRQVGVVGRSDDNAGLLKDILTASGVDPSKVMIKQFSTDQIEDMARDTALSAFMVVGPINSRITVAAISATARTRGQPKFLPVDVSEAIAQKNPSHEAEEIVEGSFNAKPAWPDDKIDTVGISHLIVARKTLSESKIAMLTRQIFVNRQFLSRETPSATQMKKPDTDKDAALPVHRGAAAYVDNNEKSFLDGYSDYIWFAVLALSGIGSAYAWARRFIAKDEWEGVSALSEKILALIDDARRAANLRELASLEEQVDDLIGETLKCYDDDLLEEQDLSMLSLLFQRFQHVVAIRRSSLTHAPESDAHLRAV
jgi:hypothetical protein